jgi:hypothetical protein
MALVTTARYGGAYALGDEISTRVMLTRAIDLELEATLGFRRTLAVRGTLRARDFGDCAASGAMTLGTTITLAVNFVDAAGDACTLAGTQRLSLAGHPPEASILRAHIARAGVIVARAELRFDLRVDSWHLLASARRAR